MLNMHSTNRRGESMSCISSGLGYVLGNMGMKKRKQNS